VQKRILPLAITAITLFSLFGWNCTKLDTTDIGSDLLPAVDNVHTFDTILNINTTQGFFNDSTTIGKTEDYAVGSISNDPLFGLTKASIYMQLKPPFYPYYFSNAGDTIVALDSVVLCLKYTGFWGDSLMPIHLVVQEVNDLQFGIDSVNTENTTAYKPNPGATLTSADIDVRTLGNYIKLNNGRDSVINQIRIKLPASWAAQLFNRDSIKANGANNAYYSDSLYRRFYNGIAVIGGGGGNGLIYVNLADTATKLEINYRRKAFGAGGVVDSVYSSFRLNSSFADNAANAPASNTSDYILRSRSGPVLSSSPSEHYLQTAPGTFVNLHIPGLAGLSNRIIHRAEIIVEQTPPVTGLDDILSAPNFLYLDLKDSGTANKWKPIYFDLNTAELYDPDYTTLIPYMPTTINYQYYGGYRRSKADGMKYYNINISRYVQQIVTDHKPVYDMRLYAPFNLSYPQYSTAFIPYSNNIAFGRVRIGSGSNTNYPLRLRIVYSKL
jgi:Domain of unknown function (DUF4270)